MPSLYQTAKSSSLPDSFAGGIHCCAHHMSARLALVAKERQTRSLLDGLYR